MTRAQALKEDRRQKKLERYETAVALSKKGVSTQNIASQLGISCRTANRLLKAGDFPDSSTRAKRRKLVDPFRNYLDKRWREGCHNAASLFRELKKQNYQGAYGTVYEYLDKRWNPQKTAGPRGKNRGSPKATAPPSARQLAWLFLYPEKALHHIKRREGDDASQIQEQALLRLSQGESDLKTHVLIARQFIDMVANRKPEDLDTWIKTASKDGGEDLASFAQGIRQDYAAIRAALELDISNGQVEGQVNRLKTQKRQMYGRAALDLLKARLVSPA